MASFRRLLTTQLANDVVGRTARSISLATSPAGATLKNIGAAVPSSSSPPLLSVTRCLSRATLRPTQTLLTSARTPLETFAARGAQYYWRSGGGCGFSLARQQQRRGLFSIKSSSPPTNDKLRQQLFSSPHSDIGGGRRSFRSRPLRGRADKSPRTLGDVLDAVKRAGAVLVFPFMLAWKYKVAVLSALKLTKFSSLASLAMTTAGYAALFGIPYGVGVTAQILIHESGHALALMRYGIPFQPMVFVPFMGAYVAHAGTLSAWQGAMVSLAGPAAGCVAAAALYVAGVVLATDAPPKAGRTGVWRNGRQSVRDGSTSTPPQLLHALADFGCMINLFNLLPLGSLDGGQVAATLHPSLLVVGCVAGTAMVYHGEVNNPIVYLILLGGYYTAVARYMGWEAPRPGMVNLSPRGKVVVAGAYAGLAAILAGLMSLNQARLYGPRGEKPGMVFEEDSPYAAEFDRLVKQLPEI